MNFSTWQKCIFIYIHADFMYFIDLKKKKKKTHKCVKNSWISDGASRSGCLGLFGDGGPHDCLAMLALGFTHVFSKVNGFHVLYRQDALGDARGVAHTSVNQPPGSLDVNGSGALHNMNTWFPPTVTVISNNKEHNCNKLISLLSKENRKKKF